MFSALQAPERSDKVIAIEVASPQGSGSSKEQLAQLLIAMSGFTKELETQAHLAHVNYEDSNFLSVHPFLQESGYEQHLEQLDRLLEYVRTLDFFDPMCSCGLREASPPFENITSYDGRHMLMTYMGNLETAAQHCDELERVAGEARVIEIQNYAAELRGQHTKAIWMLRALLR